MGAPIILGIICHQGHSSSAALVVDGRLVAAASEERFSRKKDDGSFPHRAIRFVLENSGIELREVDAVAFAWDPWLSLRKQAPALIRGLPWSLRSLFDYLFRSRTQVDADSRVKRFVRMLGLRREFKKYFRHCPPVTHVNHHLAHAASAYYQSEFQAGACLIGDGCGEHASITAYSFQGGAITRLFEVDFPHSLGSFYTAITELLGMRPERDEFRVMGLASYGRDERFGKDVRKMVVSSETKPFELNLDYFLHQRSGKSFHSPLLAKLLGPLNSPESKIAVAASAQAVLEESVLHLVRRIRQRIGQETAGQSGLCLAGGVFLNCAMNQKSRESGIFRDYYFSPIADDAGTAVGAAQYLSHALSGSRPVPIRRMDLGPEYSDADIQRALSSRGDLVVEKVESPESAAAELLAGSKVVAWFQGRMEFGPRALGHRSILADPRRRDMTDLLNLKIKTRERYQPFAPATTYESFDRFFRSASGNRDFPYMIENVSAKPAAVDRIPAVVHVDNTCRVQTVKESDNAPFHRLLKHFEALTGVPVVLNTSFNRGDEPIVASPEDAVAAFMGSDIDCLVIGHFLVSKRSIRPRAAAAEAS